MFTFFVKMYYFRIVIEVSDTSFKNKHIATYSERNPTTSEYCGFFNYETKYKY